MTKPLDTTKPNIARMYDYWLGGKDNISQVVSRWPYNGRTVTIQAAHGIYSNTGSLTVRDLYYTCMCLYVRFFGRAFLTLT